MKQGPCSYTQSTRVPAVIWVLESCLDQVPVFYPTFKFPNGCFKKINFKFIFLYMCLFLLKFYSNGFHYGICTCIWVYACVYMNACVCVSLDSVLIHLPPPWLSTMPHPTLVSLPPLRPPFWFHVTRTPITPPPLKIFLPSHSCLFSFMINKHTHNLKSRFNSCILYN